MSFTHREIRFEEAIEDHLLGNGWIKGSVADYDRKRALDPRELFAFIAATQAKEWKRLVVTYGGDEATARAKFLDRVVKKIDERGTLAVLRRGVDDRGVHIKLAEFKPAHRLTPELEQRYNANRLTITRQLPYSAAHHRTLDVALFINGIPVATAELKNPLTAQTIDHAKAQYRQDRDPRDTFLSRRAVVHFAVDPDEVALTTKLAGPVTLFLPFNRGHQNGAGNPPAEPGKYRTSYLWERVWQRDAWLDLFGRFVSRVQEKDDEGNVETKTLFPRFHQWDAVLKIEAHARQHGPGHQYLIEHSAGSGKSNTIAWTAYRLATLHDENDRKVFDKVLVVTDRLTLDAQLQGTIRQFEQTPGAVITVEKKSRELIDALSSPQALVVVSIQQKFPFVVDQLRSLKKGNYAVLVDEAHSSQTGETAKAIKVILGSGPAALDEAEAEDAAEEEASDPQEALVDATARGRQANLSYIAFTATPKPKTMLLFGTEQEDGNFAPFHLYSMRQAIQEGFILDVLTNYATYSTYYKVARRISEDPELDRSKAASAIARFVALEPHQLDQKAEVIVEHFRRVTAKKIGGQAKAMVVTRSRLHAVRYYQAIARYIASKSYKDLRPLVAFSGTIVDGGMEYTEPKMNGFSEKSLPRHFRHGPYQILVVAEKYQTGFDEPRLHTMYIDKKLEGVKAVQTLSRLNRTHPGKDDTFILDFVNRTDDIQDGFRQFYEESIAEPVDPNQLYDSRDVLLDFDIIDQADVHAFAVALAAAPQTKGVHAALYVHLDPARDRFKALERENQLRFRDALDTFVRRYAFLGQIAPFTDAELEKLYLYGRLLQRRLPPEVTGQLDLGDEVELTHLRIEFTGQHDLSVDEGEPLLRGLGGDATGASEEPQKAKLSEIIETLNERFGLNLTDRDRFFFQQLKEDMIADEELAKQARANTIENYGYGFDRAFTSTAVDRRNVNEELFRRLMDDERFAQAVKSIFLPEVYDAQRRGDAS